MDRWRSRKRRHALQRRRFYQSQHEGLLDQKPQRWQQSTWPGESKRRRSRNDVQIARCLPYCGGRNQSQDWSFDLLGFQPRRTGTRLRRKAMWIHCERAQCKKHAYLERTNEYYRRLRDSCRDTIRLNAQTHVSARPPRRSSHFDVQRRRFNYASEMRVLDGC